jgi:acyl phosphate:glycerol-3-phosphate acyltransferase
MTPLMWWLMAAPAGYLLGSMNPAALIARIFGVDIRQVGSGNPGATNIGRALGPRWAVLVGAIDILKGFLPALVFGLLGGEIAGEVAGLAAVLGHVTSPWLHGHGGKGVATTLGAILGVQPWLAIPVLIVFLVGVKVFHRVGLGAVMAAVALAVSGVIGGIFGWFDPSDVAFSIILAAIVLWRHQRNIRAAINPRV